MNGSRTRMVVEPPDASSMSSCLFLLFSLFFVDFFVRGASGQ